MKRSACDVRAMLREHLNPYGPISDAEVVEALEKWWSLSKESEKVSKVFAACGLLAYGKVENLEAALEVIVEDPFIIIEKPARYTYDTLWNVLPLPAEMVSQNSYRLLLEWYLNNKAVIKWNETTELFEFVTSC